MPSAAVAQDSNASENAHLADAQAAIDRLLAVKGPRTVDNTLVPYDDAVRHINSAAYLSGILQQVDPETAFRDAATAMTTRVSGVQTALSLNRDVYHALSSIVKNFLGRPQNMEAFKKYAAEEFTETP